MGGLAEAYSRGKIKVANALEAVIGDQSLLNHFFKRNYKHLPKSFNVNKRWFQRGCSDPRNFYRLLNGTHAVHFLADQKPWDRDLDKLSPEMLILDKLWHSHCPFSKK